VGEFIEILTKKGTMMSTKNLESNKVIYEYVLQHSLRESEVLQELRELTAKDNNAVMQIPPEQGQFMGLLMQLIKAKRTIEIGVFTGYSTLCVAQAMPDDSYTLACDVSEKWTNIAQEYWEKAGVREKIELKIAPAIETLDTLLDNAEAGTFDFIFIDADKENYDNYYERSLKLLRQGGLIAIDNVLMFGNVVDGYEVEQSKKKHFTDQSIKAMKALNQKIKEDDRVDISMLMMADGITLLRKK
jgi:caffeoyl-CoA O-methyltransferase